MLGGIIGDIVGSIYEDGNMKTKDFPFWNEKCHFTDDTVLTIATADCIMNRGKFENYYYSYATEYPHCGYGTGFMKWLFIKKYRNKFIPYGSYGNGSAMRVSPIGWAYNSIDDVKQMSKISAKCTHNSVEGIRGAQAIACSVFLAKMNAEKKTIKQFVENEFNYDLSLPISEVKKNYRWNATCQNTVPQAILSFLESKDFEDSIRNAISFGGDSDTIACMAGSISEAYYGIPIDIQMKAFEYLPVKLQKVLNRFAYTFKVK